jgi:hypothetical protein
MNVRVYNDNKYEHREKFRGDIIVIPPGEYVEMNREDAVLFKSQFTPVIRNKGGADDPAGFKMLRIDYNPDAAGAVKDVVAEHEADNTCMSCGFIAKSKTGLASHIRANHTAQMVDDDAREAIENL